jgi:hypothetical protein
MNSGLEGSFFIKASTLSFQAFPIFYTLVAIAKESFATDFAALPYLFKDFV